MSDKDLKPLVALYKVYRGGEWFTASLESIRSHCAGIVVVASEQPWRNSPAPMLPENCRRPLEAFQDAHRDCTVLTLRHGEAQTSEEQYAAGLAVIKAVFGSGVGILLIDTDEIWEEAELLALRRAMTAHPRAKWFRSGIWTYLRSPLYRVAPQEKARPVVGLANADVPTGRSRLADLYRLSTGGDDVFDVPNCNVHHYGYVRVDPEELVGKLASVATQDKVGSVPEWKQRVWDRLPVGENLHPQVGFARCWSRVEELPLRRQPALVTQTDAFWAGLICHRVGRLRDLLFTADDPEWRTAAGAMPPEECPATVVPSDMRVPLARYVEETLGKRLEPDAWWSLVPRFRMSLRELVQLAVLAASHIPSGGSGGRALEIGSGHGGSMAMLTLAAPVSATLFACDPYTPYDEQNAVLNRAVEEGSPERFADTVSLLQSGALATGRVRLFGMTSHDLALQGRSDLDSLDLLLVDGNHSFASCKQDLELWWPRVRAGGVVLVHDYASRFPGVVRAVNEFEAEYGVRFSLPLRSTLAWARKPS